MTGYRNVQALIHPIFRHLRTELCPDHVNTDVTSLITEFLS
jgi:hypothetical protein